MQKNLLIKTLIIIAVLLVFLFGIFGIPSGFSGDALKAAVLEHIHLGLDLKGGTHLILQVMVNEAIGADSDHAIETIKDKLAKSNLTTAIDVGKPDPDNHPERIVIQTPSPDVATKVYSLVSNNLLPDYDVGSAANNTVIVTMRPPAISDLKSRTVDKSIEAIRRRVDSLGVSEPTIQKNGMGNEQILVELPGIDEIGRVKEIIQSTARLELRESRGGPYPSEQVALEAHGGRIPPNMVLLHGKSPGDDQKDVVYMVSRVPVVSGTDIRDARVGQKSNTNQPIVNFYLTASAGKKFAEFTELHRKDGADPSNLAIVLDNKVFSAPSIEGQITDSGYIEGGDFLGPKGEEHASDLAKLLQSGALPASLKYLTERTVGPSLGADSISSGVKAAIAGMLGVLIFMLIYYRGAGINANVALIFNLIILLGFLGWMNFFGMGAVLTLPGIAGVILTVGMGVDSNVLIFERIREELRAGKAPAAAVDQGFSRAWTTILDTHVTTIVSALILIFVGSGPVSGFGLTLTFGLVANLFTAVFVSRVIFDAVLSRKQRGDALSI